MKITIEITPKELADLVMQIQSQPNQSTDRYLIARKPYSSDLVILDTRTGNCVNYRVAK